ncbi:MAG: LPS export ABC transporter ATP-binding protein, partial [Elusimicrobia bacterium RIFCSPLOWO2_12_FULL_59_9]
MQLKAANLTKGYRNKPVIKGISLHVSSGEVVGLLGPNGAGKTTTFYSIVGFIRPESGDIYLDEEPITHLPMYARARKGLGYLAQEPTVFKGLTVDQNLRVVLERNIKDRREQSKLIDQLLHDFGLAKLKDQKAWTLSGGEKRRLEVSRAMIQKPKIILLDEPFVGIDPITISELKDLIQRLKSQGLGILITDHNIRETLTI